MINHAFLVYSHVITLHNSPRIFLRVDHHCPADQPVVSVESYHRKSHGRSITTQLKRFEGLWRINDGLEVV